LGTPIKYYTMTGLEITTVTCPAPSTDAIFIQPRLEQAGGCMLVFNEFSVPGELMSWDGLLELKGQSS